MKKFYLFILAVCLSFTFGFAQTIIYSTDFSTPPGTEWSLTNLSTVNHSSPYLGQLGPDLLGNPQSVVLNLGNKPPGDYQIDYNLLWFQSMDNELFELRQGVGGPIIFTRTMPSAGTEVRSETITHSGGNLVLEFFSTTDQLIPDEWWGLDDVSVSALTGSAIPTMGQWGLIGLGLTILSIGGIVLFRRRDAFIQAA